MIPWSFKGNTEFGELITKKQHSHQKRESLKIAVFFQENHGFLRAAPSKKVHESDGEHHVENIKNTLKFDAYPCAKILKKL